MSGRSLSVAAIAVAILSGACGEDPRSAQPGATATELAHFPLQAGDLPEGRDATFDAATSSDGNGSLRVDASGSGRLRLYALDAVDPGAGRLVYTGFLRSRDLEGTAFLELRCRPPQGDPSFVRGPATAVRGSAEWTPQVVGFSNPALCRGPAAVELNVVIQGSGTIWIDDLRLWSVPPE